MTRTFETASREAKEYGLNLADIPEDDRLDSWPWSKKYLAKIDADMARGAFDSMLQMLDQLGVPKGTFSDDQLLNFIAMYNNRGDVITSLQSQLESLRNKDIDHTDESVAHIIEHNRSLTETLIELANWPIKDDNSVAKGMKAVAASMVDPSRVNSLQILLK